MASRGPLGGDAVVIGDRKVRAADILGRLHALVFVFAKVREPLRLFVVFPALPPFMRVPIRECSDGTWIAIVSGGSRCFEYWSCSANNVYLTGDTSRHGDQRYVHVSPRGSAWPGGDPSGGTR